MTSISAFSTKMTIDQVQAWLKTYISGTTLNLPGAHATTLSAPIGQLLMQSQIFPQADLQMTLTNTILPKKPTDPLIFEGNLTGFFLKNETPPGKTKPTIIQQTPYKTTATFYIDSAGIPQLELHAQMKPTWQIKDAFTTLDDTELGDVPWGVGGFVAASADNNGLKSGLNFFGPLPAGNRLFFPVEAFFNTGSQLASLRGPITLPSNLENPPTMNLTTGSGKADVQIGSVDISVQVSAKAGLDVKGTPIGTLTLSGTLQLASISEELIFTAMLEGSGRPTVLSATVSNKPLPGGLDDLNSLSSGSVFGSVVPSTFELGTGLTLGGASITLVTNPFTKKASIVSVGVSVTLSPQTPWTLIPDVIEISSIGIGFTVAEPFSSPSLSATVMGSFELGAATQGPVDVAVTVPGLTVAGGLANNATIDVEAFIAKIFGGGPTPGQGPKGSKLVINQLQFFAQPSEKTYNFQGGIGTNLTIPGLPASTLDVTELSFQLNRTQTDNSLFFMGNVTFLGQALRLTATKSDTTSPWSFAGYMVDAAKFTDIVDHLVPASWGLSSPSSFPKVLQTLEITSLGASFTPSLGDYSVQAAFDWPFTFDGTKLDFDIAAAIDLQSSKDQQGQKSYSGQISGDLDFNGLTMALIYQFAPNSKKIIFKYEQLTVTYGPTPPTDPTLAIAFGNQTLGGMLDAMLQLGDPGAKIHFPSPWDKLLDINLDGLTITIHLKTKEIEVEYLHDFNFVFIDLQGFSISYQKLYGKSKFTMKVFGTFMGTTYTKENPVMWDPVNGTPPSATPGSKILDVMYVGLGQHVTLAQPPGPTVEAVITQMKQALMPPANPTKSPVAQMPDLRFDAASQWMIGGQFIIDNSFYVAAVFNDPEVYGLLIEANGPSAAALQGLKFEILYRKISNDLGQYHIDFVLPNQFRYLQFGEVTVVLPEVIIDIFTNGNFKINAGFPPTISQLGHSFSVQVFPFIGFGGLYFGYLNGQTSSSVPSITNGRFDPVIEFGFALAVGLGKTLQVGPLSGGAYITVIGELQGTFATFHPTQNGLPTAKYYDIIGTIGLVGKVYGTVNFVVVQASISLMVTAEIQMEVRPHEPILISMSAGVRVSASVKILFVRIHFHFHATIHESFTIGHQTQAPWIVGPAPHSPSLLSPSYAARRLGATKASRKALLAAHKTMVSHHAISAGLMAAGGGGGKVQPAQAGSKAIFSALTPSPLCLLHPAAKVGKSGATHGLAARFKRTVPVGKLTMTAPKVVAGVGINIPVWVTPVATQALDGDLNLTGKTANPVAALAPLLAVQISADPNAASVRSTVKGTGTEEAFDKLGMALMKWAITDLIGSGTTISALQLLDMKFELGDAETIETAFSFTNLSKFFTAAGVSFDLAPRPTTGAVPSVAMLPMPPAVVLSCNGTQVTDFATQLEVGKTYETAIDQYLSQLQADYANDVEKDPSGIGAKGVGGVGLASGGKQSFAAYMFSNYFVAVLRQLVESSIDLLAKYPLALPTDTSKYSLQTAADIFPETTMAYTSVVGDTLLTIAEISGLSPEEVQVANPTVNFDPLVAGTAIIVPVKVTTLGLLQANWQRAGLLTAGKNFSIEGVTYPLGSSDTMAAIAKIIDCTVPELADENARTKDLFQSGTILPIGNISYTTTAVDTAQSIADYFNDAAAAMVVLTAGQKLTLPASTSYANVTTDATTNNTVAAIAAQSKIAAADLAGFYADVLAHNDAITVVASKPYSFTGITLAVDGSGFNVPYQVQAGNTLDSVIDAFFPDLKCPNGCACDPKTLSGEAKATCEARQSIALRIKKTNADIDFTAATLPTGKRLNIPYAYTLQNIAIYYKLSWSAANPSGTLGTVLAAVSAIYSKLAVLELPTFTAPIQANDTFNTIASRYNLTAAQLDNAIAGEAGNFVASEILYVPHAPAIDVATLITDLFTEGAYTNAANMASRFFLHGLRLPDPDDTNFTNYIAAGLPAGKASTIKTYPLYALSGQEFAAPTGSLAAVTLSFTPSPSQTASWINLGTAGKLDVPLDAKELAQIKAFSTQAMSPAVAWSQADLGYGWTPKRYPMRHKFHWQAGDAPASLKPSTQVTGDLTIWPVPSSLITEVTDAGTTGQKMEVELTARGAGGLTETTPVAPLLWGTLLDVVIQKLPAVKGQPTPPEGVYMLDGTDHAGMQRILSVLAYLEANKGDSISIHLLYEPNATETNASGYVSSALDGTKTFLMKTNLSTVAHPAGSGAMLTVAAPPASATTPLSSVQDFLRLTYECSVVQSGGFYLNYGPTTGKPELPKTIFKEGDSAKVGLMLVLDSASNSAATVFQPFNNVAIIGQNLDTSHSHVSAAKPVRQVGQKDTLTTLAASMVAFGATAETLAVANADITGLLVPGASVKNGSTSYVITPSDTITSVVAKLGLANAQAFGSAFSASTGLLRPGAFVGSIAGQLIAKPDTLPGNVGFTLARTEPATGHAVASPTDEALLEGLYNLVGYSLEGSGGFIASMAGMPIGPTDTEAVTKDGLDPVETDDGLWIYQHSLSVNTFADPSVDGTPVSAALPAASENMYRGISASAKATLSANLQDIFGNEVGAAGALPVIESDVRFSDDIMAPDSWPGMARSYSIEGSGTGAAQFKGMLIGSAAAYIIHKGQPFLKVQSSARVDRERAKKIWYQLQSITATIDAGDLGTLVSSSATATLGEETKQLLLDSALQNYLFLDSLASMTPVVDAAKVGDTLGGIAAGYSTDAGALLAANPDMYLQEIYGNSKPIDLPKYYMTGTNDTPLEIVNNDATKLASLAADNADAPLNEGVAINRPAISIAITGAKQLSLSEIAAQNDAPLLSVQSNTTPQTVLVKGVAASLATATLASGVGLTLTHSFPTSGTVSFNHKTGTADTLTIVAANFQAQIRGAGGTSSKSKPTDADAVVTVDDVAHANQYVSGILPENTPKISLESTIVPAKTSLLEFAEVIWGTNAGASGQLLNDNQKIPAIFVHGIGLVVGAIAYTLQESDTPATLASEQSLKINDLGTANKAVPFTGAVSLEIPYQMAVPNGYGTFRPVGSEQLNTIVAVYSGWTIDACAALNQDVAGLFVPGVVLAGNSKTHTAKLSDTPTSVATALGYTGTTAVSAFMTAIGGTANLLRPGATLLTPRMVAEGTLAQTVTKYWPYFTSGAGKDDKAAEWIAQANAALAGLIPSGQTVKYVGLVAPIKTGTNETFSSLAATINQQLGANKVSASDVAVANPTIALNPVALVTAPGESTLTASLTAAPKTACFPLAFTLTMSRERAAVAEKFQGTNAETVTSILQAAPIAEASTDGKNLKKFASMFEAALPGLKIATGPKPVTQGAHGIMAKATEPSQSKPALWAVNFSSSFGTSYSFKPDVDGFSQFAVAPLSNRLWVQENASVGNYVSGTGLKGTTPTNITNGMPDVWGRELLELVDKILSPDYAVPAEKIDSASLASLISSKASLAELYAGNLKPIFTSQKGDLASASETLKQEMLIELDTAYKVESIVQLPFTATGASTGTAPRLYAKPKANLVNVGTNTTIAGLATSLNLDSTFVVQILMEQTFIVAPGQKLTFGSNSYTTSASDTFATILNASEFQGNAPTIADLVSGAVSPATILQPNAVVNATLVTSTLQAASGTIAQTVLSDVANQFDVLPSELLQANANNKNVFAANTTITFTDGGSYAVQQGDCATTIAAAQKLSIPALADALWRIDIAQRSDSDCAAKYKLNGGGVLSLLRLVPQYNLSTSSVALDPAGSSANFLFTVKNPADQKSVVLDLDMDVTSMQINIEENTAVPGFEQSEWLHFVRPIGKNSLGGLASDVQIGQTELATPLREYISHGSIGNQKAIVAPVKHNKKSGKGAATPVVDWSYQVDLKRSLVAQDVVSFNMLVDVAPPPISRNSLLSAGAINPFYLALATIHNCVKGISSDLDAITGATLTAADKAKAGSALKAAATLAAQMVSNWASSTAVPLNVSADLTGLAKEQYSFTLAPVPSEDKIDEFGYLTLRAASSNPLRFIFGMKAPSPSADVAVLHSGKVPADIEAGFAKAGFTLSATPSVTTKTTGGSWQVTDNENLQTYLIDLRTGTDQAFIVSQLYFWPVITTPGTTYAASLVAELDKSQCPTLLGASSARVKVIKPGHKWLLENTDDNFTKVLYLDHNEAGQLVISSRRLLTSVPGSAGTNTEKTVQLGDTLLIPLVNMPEIGDTLDLRFDFERLMVLSEQNAAASNAVARNADLTPHSTTDAAFVYETSPANVPNPLAATVVHPEVIAINSYGADFASALMNFIEGELFQSLAIMGNNQTRYIKLDGAHVSSLQGAITSSEDISSAFPLSISTAFSYVAGQKSSFPADFAAAVKSFAATAGAPTKAGGYMVRLQIFTDLHNLPGDLLLELDKLYYDLS